MELGVAIMHI